MALHIKRFFWIGGFLFASVLNLYAGDLLFGVVRPPGGATDWEREIQQQVLETIQKWSSSLVGPSTLWVVPAVGPQPAAEGEHSEADAEAALPPAATSRENPPGAVSSSAVEALQREKAAPDAAAAESAESEKADPAETEHGREPEADSAETAAEEGRRLTEALSQSVLDDGSAVTPSLLDTVDRMWFLNRVQTQVEVSLNHFYYTTVQLDFVLRELITKEAAPSTKGTVGDELPKADNETERPAGNEGSEQENDGRAAAAEPVSPEGGTNAFSDRRLEIRVAGFDPDKAVSAQKALEEIPGQLLAQLIGADEHLSGVRIVEILDKNEVVVNIGKKEGVYVGASFSLLKYTRPLAGETEEPAKPAAKRESVFGQLFAYKVTDEVSYCRVLFKEADFWVGDYVRLDKRVGLTSQLRTGVMASLNGQSDIDTSGAKMSSGQIQTGKAAAAFSEFVGFVGIREVVDYGTAFIHPFFGLDFFLDGPMGALTGELSAEQLFAVGRIEGESFAFRRPFSGWVRPYVGFQADWNINRVSLSPFLAMGMILNPPFSFSAREETQPPSGRSYETVPGSVFHYFTLESGLDVEVRIDGRFSFLASLGYQSWVGNLIDLKSAFSRQKQRKKSVETKFLEQTDFLKFYDWQYLTLGLGFSISY